MLRKGQGEGAWQGVSHKRIAGLNLRQDLPSRISRDNGGHSPSTGMIGGLCHVEKSLSRKKLVGERAQYVGRVSRSQKVLK